MTRIRTPISSKESISPLTRNAITLLSPMVIDRRQIHVDSSRNCQIVSMSKPLIVWPVARWFPKKIGRAELRSNPDGVPVTLETVHNLGIQGHPGTWNPGLHAHSRYSFMRRGTDLWFCPPDYRALVSRTPWPPAIMFSQQRGSQETGCFAQKRESGLSKSSFTTCDCVLTLSPVFIQLKDHDCLQGTKTQGAHQLSRQRTHTRKFSGREGWIHSPLDSVAVTGDPGQAFQWRKGAERSFVLVAGSGTQSPLGTFAKRRPVSTLLR